MVPEDLIRKCLSSENCPNLLFYGIGDIYPQFKTILNDRFNISNLSCKTCNNFEVYFSHIHYEINMNKIKNNNINEFNDFFEDFPI